MKKFLFILAMTGALSCSNDNYGPGCDFASDFDENGLVSKSSTTMANQHLVIEYVDAKGKNLFENGIYDPSEVRLTYKGETTMNVVDQVNEETKNMIYLNVYSEGKNLFYLSLRPIDSKIDVVAVYSTMVDISSCTGPVFAIDSIFLDDKKQSATRLNDGLLKLAIAR